MEGSHWNVLTAPSEDITEENGAGQPLRRPEEHDRDPEEDGHHAMRCPGGIYTGWQGGSQGAEGQWEGPAVKDQRTSMAGVGALEGASWREMCSIGPWDSAGGHQLQ